MSEFIVIDVETANECMDSICQIGLAKYNNGKLVEEWVTLVNPQQHFSSFNIGIHGISPEHVVSAPLFVDIYEKLTEYMQGSICICHGSFDRTAFYRAFHKYGLQNIETTWLDSTRIARRTWEDVRYKGYNLKNLAAKIGYEFKHHDALEDAKAAGEIVLQAIQITGIDIEGWLESAFKPLDLSSSSTIKADGNPDGNFFGEVLVFTGALVISRREAAKIASDLGFTVATGVTKKTTMLVIGDQDMFRMADGEDKSSKQRKAEDLIAKGQYIRILQESDFSALLHK